MAKSVHLNEIVPNQGSAVANLPAGGFWEHWFDTQPVQRPPKQNLDEHSIWESALNLGVFTIEKLKR